MNWKRAFIGAIVLWALIFFEVSILMYGLNLSPPSIEYYVIHFIALAIFIILITVSYFHSKRIKLGFKEGLEVGLVFVITGIILDSLITVPLFVKNYGFLLRGDILAGIVETVAIAGIVGWFMRKK